MRNVRLSVIKSLASIITALHYVINCNMVKCFSACNLLICTIHLCRNTTAAINLDLPSEWVWYSIIIHLLKGVCIGISAEAIMLFGGLIMLFPNAPDYVRLYICSEVSRLFSIFSLRKNSTVHDTQCLLYCNINEHSTYRLGGNHPVDLQTNISRLKTV